MELVEAAARDGALALSGDTTIDNLNETQPHQVNKKMYVAARYAGLTEAGRLITEAQGMRLTECSELADQTELERQRVGAFERATSLGSSPAGS